MYRKCDGLGFRLSTCGLFLFSKELLPLVGVGGDILDSWAARMRRKVKGAEKVGWRRWAWVLFWVFQEEVRENDRSEDVKS